MRAHVIAAAFGMAMILAGEAVADGPWKGKIVDAETGQRLSGAVVLAAWWKRSPGVVHERTAFYDATEVVTDDEGRFVIPPVKTATLNPFTPIDGPDLKIFKRGYGQWRFRGEPQLSPSNTLEWERWRATAWKRFTSDGIVIELPALKSKEDRFRFREVVAPSSLIPPERTPQMTRAIEEEDAWLGIRPAPRH